MLQFCFVDSISRVDGDAWDALCPADYPFIRYGFFNALELSGATTARSGWQPHHLLAYREGQLVAAQPWFIKSHSYGEYVFDGGWANAWQQLGHNYYPKLVNAIPFTPCTGPRLLLDSSLDLTTFLPALTHALDAQCQRLGASGWHSLFVEQASAVQWQQQGAALRSGCQFHWHNRGYATFDDFLATLLSRKRKHIIQERSRVAAQGISFSCHDGENLSAADCTSFYNFYQMTYLKRSGHRGYLTSDFFVRIARALPRQCLLIQAHKDNQVIAAAWFFKDSTTLYGRYWGCLAEYDFLHFETCYYQGIDYLIREGLQRFDGGAQGEHKIQRGFEACETFSLHRLQDDHFHQAVENFVGEEQLHIEHYIADVKAASPYRHQRAAQ